MLELLMALIGATATAGTVPREPNAYLRALVGLTYDSRILIAPDSMFDQGQPTKFGDYRVVTTGDLSYWAVSEGRHHWGPVGAFALTNTAQNAHAAGDPYRFSLAAPYLLDFDGDHPHRMVIRPTIQTLVMDPTLTTRKSVVQNSAILAFENTWRTDARWDAMLGLEYRRDDATTRQSVGPYDADANKFTIRGREVYYPARDRRHALALDLALIRNQAVGKFMQYDRVEGGVTFAAPAFRRSTWSMGLGVYRLNFPSSIPKRSDTNVTASTGFSTPIADRWSFEANAGYTRNSGRTPLWTYDRFTIMTAIVVATGL